MKNNKLGYLLLGIILIVIGIYLYVFSDILHWTLSWAILMLGIILIAFWEYHYNNKNKIRTNNSQPKKVKNDFPEIIN